MTYQEATTALLDRQRDRISRARRLADASDHALHLADLRSLERSALACSLQPGSIETFLARSATLTRSMFHHQDRARRLNRLATDQLTRT